MSLKAALISALKAEPTVAALVGARVYPTHPARGATLPSLTVSVASDLRGKDLDGHTSQRVARVLFAVRAATDESSEAVARALDEFLPTLARETIGAVEIKTALQQGESDEYVQPGDGTDKGPRLRIVDYRFDYRT